MSSNPVTRSDSDLGLSAEVNAQLEAAMKAGGPPPARAEAPKPRLGGGAIRGPRVVQAGREHRSGTVVSVGPTDIFLEFGPKELGVAPRAQWPEEQIPKVGDALEVVIEKFEPSESLFLCVRPGAVTKAAWESLEPGQVVDAKVTGVNKGGLELEVAGHAAFMPAGQVGLDRIPDLSVLVGEKMSCQVVRVDRTGRGNIVLSRREILEQERRRRAEELKTTLQEGQILDGTVKKIMPFGAFVDIGGVEGLVHISDLTYERAGYGENRVSKFVQVGQSIRVQILKLDWENNRLSLGVKQVQADPFATAVGDIKDGADVTGRVTRIAEFGAFVEIAPGVEGLVHISELAYRRVGKVDEVLKQDEVIKARVLRVDPQTRRISLSVKALTPPPEPTAQPGQPGGQSGFRGKPGKDRGPKGPTAEEILKETPALRRMREKFGKTQFKGGIA